MWQKLFEVESCCVVSSFILSSVSFVSMHFAATASIENLSVNVAAVNIDSEPDQSMPVMGSS